MKDKKTKLHFVGNDWYCRRVYQDQRGYFYKEIELFDLPEVPKTLYLSCPPRDIEGEPDRPITDFEIV